ncbi:Putative flagellar capping protein [Candidatus Bealeia paramacronuclearis]|uniref:Flagellar capping protein n=1 Tax=Candidatus Bealeia paramacronuclearis TaxID=1921001 RepID=A0ABZ2C7J4_9PROT|nr:putative flagellar capping protein [Candidatus Bealeia paramacronuclearis]
MVDSVSSPTSSMSVTKRDSGAYGMTQRKMGDAEIDAAAIADGPIEVAEARTKIIQEKIDGVKKRRDVLHDLKPDLLALSKTVDTLRGMSKASGVENVFDKRLGMASGLVSKLDQTYVAVNTQDGASVRSFDIKIQQQASSDVLTSGASLYYGDTTTALGLAAGNLSINGSSVAITNTMNLTDVMNAINSSPIFTVQGVQAQIQTTTLLGVTFNRLSLTPQMGGKLTISDDQGSAIKNALHFVNNEYTSLNLTGNLVIDGRTIAIDPSMTIYDVRNAIRIECSQQLSQPATADVDIRGNGDYRLFVSRKDTGAPQCLWWGRTPVFFQLLDGLCPDLERARMI